MQRQGRDDPHQRERPGARPQPNSSRNRVADRAGGRRSQTAPRATDHQVFYKFIIKEFFSLEAAFLPIILADLHLLSMPQ